MWVAKLKVWHKESYSAEKTRHFEASFSAFNLNAFERGGKTWMSRAIIAYGPEADKLISAMRNDPRIEVEEIKGRQILFNIPAENQFHSLQLDRTVFLLKPVSAKGGLEYWTVGSVEKKHINDLVKRINKLKPEAWAELLKVSQEDVDLFIPTILSKLTEKQRWAYETACRLGYYSYPREMDLEQIAKKLGVPVSTFREHLRLAESKLLPALGNTVSVE